MPLSPLVSQAMLSTNSIHAVQGIGGPDHVGSLDSRSTRNQSGLVSLISFSSPTLDLSRVNPFPSSLDNRQVWNCVCACVHVNMHVLSPECMMHQTTVYIYIYIYSLFSRAHRVPLFCLFCLSYSLTGWSARLLYKADRGMRSFDKQCKKRSHTDRHHDDYCASLWHF